MDFVYASTAIGSAAITSIVLGFSAPVQGAGEVGTAADIQIVERVDNPQEPAAVPSTGHFIANRGQFSTGAEFVGFYPGMLVRAERDALWLQCQPPGPGRDGVLLRWSFPGSTGGVELEGIERLPVAYSYFQGADPDGWHRDVGAYRQVRYRDVHPGIDLVVRTEDGHPKYDVLVEPGADLATFVVRCEGAIGRHVDSAGVLVLETGAGPLRQPTATAWEVRGDGTQRHLNCRFRLIGSDAFGFEVVDRDPELALVIDPGLFWSTYLGGSQAFSTGDIGQAIAFGPDGSATAVGGKEGFDFPQSPGTFTTGIGSGDEIFVTRLSGRDGSLIYSSVIGGSTSFQDRAQAVAVDGLGRATVVGYADSVDFPTTPGAWDRIHDGPFDTFVLRLNSAGTDLEFATFLGGEGGDLGQAVVLAPNGSAIVGGYTGGSTQFPTTPGAFDTIYEMQGEISFITRFAPDGSALEWSTLLGFASTKITALAIAPNGDVVGTGTTGNTVSFPTTPGAWVQFVPSTLNAFACRLSADGSTLQWGSVFGGNGVDRPYAVALLPDGGTVVAGIAQSFTNFPTTPGVLQTQPTPSISAATAFIVRLRPDGSAPVYSTLLGQGFDGAKGMAADPSGVVTIAGAAWTGFAPATPGAHDSLNQRDIGITRINPSATKVLYSTSLGGLGDDDCKGMAMTSTGRVAIVGDTTGDYPTTPGAAQLNYAGGQTDAFVSLLDLVPTGVRAYGRPTSGCRGPLVLNAFAMPTQGAADFSLYASGLPPSATARFLISETGLNSAQANSGVNVWIDLTARLKRVAVTADADGFVDVSIPELVAGPPGTRRFVQLVADGTAACGGVGTRCATNALEVTVQ